MAHIFIKNSLSNSKAVKVDLNLPTYVTTDSKGDPIWLLEVATTYPSASGTKIRPVYINATDAAGDLDEAIADAVAKIASQIDWGTLSEDNDSPYIEAYKPIGDNVPIASNINIEIKDAAPSSGIDLSNTKVFLNNGVTEFDITNECFIEGDPFSYIIHWQPPTRIYKKY